MSYNDLWTAQYKPQNRCQSEHYAVTLFVTLLQHPSYSRFLKTPHPLTHTHTHLVAVGYAFFGEPPIGAGCCEVQLGWWLQGRQVFLTDGARLKQTAVPSQPLPKWPAGGHHGTATATAYTHTHTHTHTRRANQQWLKI